MKLDAGSVPVHAFWFGEDASRVVVSYAPEHESRVEQACEAAQVPFTRAGTVGGRELVIEGVLQLGLDSLSRAWRSGIPAVLKQTS